VRVGLVGCGRLAEAGYLPAFAGATGVELVGVCDPDPARRARVAALAGVPAGEDLAGLLGRAPLDTVVLATPAAAHVDDAEAAVAHGLVVLVEKPPAPDAAGAARLAALGPAVRIGFNRRFDPGAERLRRAVAPSGVAHLDLELRYRRASWGALAVRDEVLIDLVPHLVDWARWISGHEVHEVSAVEVSPDRAELVLGLGDATARVRAAADALHLERIEALDRSGRPRRHRIGGPLAAVTGRIPVPRRPHPLVASLRAQLGALAAARRGEPAGALATGLDGLAAMTVVDAARESGASGGRPVTLPRPEEHRC
jgi:myo-inositol 2-dehydrogenase/D-chiro-inositol 1-dehydrogenase